MKKMFKFTLMLTLLAFIFAGCRTSTLYSVNNNSFAPANTQQVTMDNIANAIVRAGGILGWEMKKVRKGEIIGTLHLRSHMAQVRIPYTNKDYSILYNGSSNLKYNQEKNTIHSNYNGWVQNLNREIQSQLSRL